MNLTLSYAMRSIFLERSSTSGSPTFGSKANGPNGISSNLGPQSSRRAPFFSLPVGAGKTLAAWKWIQVQAGLRPVKRVLFLYPTRATATEGFKDYVSWAPEADASLIHGTGAYELDGMFENPPETDDHKPKDFGVDPRLFSIAYWSKRVFSGTVDQFLAFLHHAYGPTCLLPVLVDSIVVIDEVHSFDPAMFSSLKAFLQEFDVPVLCMTATLLCVWCCSTASRRSPRRRSAFAPRKTSLCIGSTAAGGI